MTRGNLYTPEDNEHIKNNYLKQTDDEMAKALNRSEVAIKEQRHQLEIYKKLRHNRDGIAICRNCGTVFKTVEIIFGKKKFQWMFCSDKCFTETVKNEGVSWKLIQYYISNRDKRCQFCGKEYEQGSHKFGVHHLEGGDHKYSRFKGSLNDLMLLCARCHVAINILSDVYRSQNRNPMEIFYNIWSSRKDKC